MSDSPFNAPSQESMSSLLPGFEFTAKITENAHGAVYFANQKCLERQVAIKLLNPESMRAFESKARVAAGIKHPNLISIFDSGTVGGIPYLVMEFVPGKSLAHSTKGSAVEFGQAMMLIGGICDGLSHAHDKGIVHGHFSPSNVLLNQKAEPKIGNFGLAHSTREEAGDDATLAYAAPEVLADPAAATARSDVYSTAAVFYGLITGSQHGADARPPSAICGCRPEIDAVWKQATDPDPAKRMADVHAFHVALKQAEESGRAKLATLPKAPVREPAGANAGTSGDAPPQSGKVRPAKVGFDWKLVRNLVIIVGLLYGISLTWKFTVKVRADREKTNREILAKQAVAKEEAIAAAAQKPKVLTGIPVRTDNVPVIPERPVETESPMDSLERLRTRLASGARSEMPTGIASRAGSDFLLITKPMTWADAAWFAEEHGGHLAIPDAEADPAWLFSEVAKEKAAWIGVARGGGETWVSVAGSVWETSAEPSGAGQNLSVEKTGPVAVDGTASKRPFIIQWHRNGSNPGKLATRLAAAAKSITQPNPVFPPGTVIFGDHRYLHVSCPVSWKDAHVLAESAGGCLLVVSKDGEAASLQAMTAKLDPDSRIWLGGSLEGSLWVWCTREPWGYAQWADDAPASDENSALYIQPGSGWHSLDREDEASGFIIEWSEDAKSAKAAPASPGEDATALLARAKEVVLAADRKHSEALAANTKKLGWDLDSFMRNLNKSGQAEWSQHVARVKSCVTGDRLNVEELRSVEISYSAEMLKLANYHIGKQTEIDKQFASSAAVIRDAFVTKLTEIKAKAEASGQPKLAEDTGESIDAAADLDSWLESLGVHPAPAAETE